MKMGRKTWMVAAMCGALSAAIVVAWRDHQRARASDAARRDLVSRMPRLEAELGRWEVQLDRTIEQVARAQRTSAAPSKLAPAAATGGPTAGRPALLPQQLRNDPALQVLHFKVRRAELAVSYGPFFVALGLKGDQIDRFLAARSEFEATEFDLQAIRAGGDRRDRPATQALRVAAKQELEVAQRALLGSEGFRRLQDYEKTRAARDIATAFAGGTAIAGLPLTRQQAERLTQALAEAGKTPAEPGLAFARTIDWNRADTSAAKILSPEQLALFVRSDVTRRWTLGSQRAIEEALAKEAPVQQGGR